MDATSPRPPSTARESGRATRRCAGRIARGGWRAAELVLLVLALAPLGSAQDEAPASAGPLAPELRASLAYGQRHGDQRSVLEELDGLLEETPDDHACRALRARCRYLVGDYPGTLEDARAALGGAKAGTLSDEDAAEVGRAWIELATELGRPDEALAEVKDAPELLRPPRDARDAWVLGRAQAEAGQREAANALFLLGADAPGEAWDELLARARCQRRVGRLERAAETLVEADKAASAGEGVEPDVLVELAEVYFEFYGEVDDPVSRAHSPADLCREALETARDHEGARLLLFRLHRFNWQRTSQSPEEFLDALFAARPASLPGLVARASAALDDGDLPTARAALARLQELAPGRRDARIETAALAWIEHQREEARGQIDALLAEDPGDARPERAVGEHLIELYRFAEAKPFLDKAVERDPRDWASWIHLGRAQANTGDEDGARESLARAVEVGEGRRDAWRDNTRLVLDRMSESMVLEEFGPLRFLWRPDEGAVLAAYYPDFYGQAREELAQRYGYTPGPTKIEVFRAWEDFSVRSTGFQGYPALGVCFGPVVTAVSPLCELRGTFSWARTSFHEFTHVIHLGLSNNRCPRWVTEGLATWEEGERNPAWWRNMRRDLLDARANGQILPVRRLNNAFRGPRVLFAYYQSGLLCQMLIARHGFPPMVRLLQAFDRGADLDGAMGEVFGATPEELDLEFRAFVEEKLAGLAIEPRWAPAVTFQRRFRLSRQVPEDSGARPAWADDWAKVAWGAYQQGKKIDAEEALRLAGQAGALPPRGQFLRGELLLAQNKGDEAAGAFRAGFEGGGEDYRARMALGSLLAQRGKFADATHEFEAAEKAFPGFDDPHFSAELEQAQLYERAQDEERANQARLRWLAWNAGDYPVRARTAEWLAQAGRAAESARLWDEANQVDPFRRHLHLAWGQALRALGRHAEALREFQVGLKVPLELDGDVAQAASEGLSREELMDFLGLTPEELEGLSPEELLSRARAELKKQAEDGAPRRSPFEKRFHDEEPLLWAHVALSQLELGQQSEARAAVERALALDPGCAPALEAKKRLE